jgi:hypothetical protein
MGRGPRLQVSPPTRTPRGREAPEVNSVVVSPGCNRSEVLVGHPVEGTFLFGGSYVGASGAQSAGDLPAV